MKQNQIKEISDEACNANFAQVFDSMVGLSQQTKIKIKASI